MEGTSANTDAAFKAARQEASALSGFSPEELKEMQAVIRESDKYGSIVSTLAHLIFGSKSSSTPSTPAPKSRPRLPKVVVLGTLGIVGGSILLGGALAVIIGPHFIDLTKLTAPLVGVTDKVFGVASTALGFGSSSSLMGHLNDGLTKLSHIALETAQSTYGLAAAALGLGMVIGSGFAIYRNRED